jgi:sec-independent protein translocase protein TatB
MFDIGISEIMVIAVVALVVIGPERLPRVARTIGTLLGRAQRYVNDVKAEVNREMELEELRKLQTQMQDAARSIEREVSTAGAEVQSAVVSAEQQLNQTLAAAGTADAATAAVPLPEVTPLTEPEGTPATAPAVAAAADGNALAEPPAASDAPGAAPVAPAAPPETPAGPTQTTLFPEHTVR